MVDVADEVKKHPVVRYLGLISAVAVASFGLTTQVLNETNKSTIGNYEQQLTLKDQQRLDDARKFEASIVDLTSQLAESRRINAGIPRGVSGATSILDVSKLTISPAEAGSISAAAQLYEGQDGGGFFALAPAQSAPWRYERTTELALFKELVTDAEASLPAGFDKTALTRFPVHRWVAPGTPSIEGLGPFKTLPTQILVQRMTSGDVRQLFTAAFQTPLAAATESEAADLYRGDLATLLLTMQFVNEGSLLSVAAADLQDVRRAENAVYYRLESALAGVRMNGEPAGTQYWTREAMVFTTPSTVYLVKTFFTSPDHRNAAAEDYLTRWFTDFRVLAN